jgi:archaellum component FlaC
VAKLETEVSKNPTHEHIGGVYDEIRKVSNSLSTLSTDFAGVRAVLNTLEKQIERMDTFWRNTNP